MPQAFIQEFSSTSQLRIITVVQCCLVIESYHVWLLVIIACNIVSNGSEKNSRFNMLEERTTTGDFEQDH
jgi:hypothetical protein